MNGITKGSKIPHNLLKNVPRMSCPLHSAAFDISAVATLTILAVAASSHNIAFACVAIPPGPPLEELDKSAAVFAGKVIEIQTGEKDQDSGHKINAIFFEIDRYWKSPESFNGYNTLVVFSELSGDVCGYEFEGGKEYLVYSWINERDGSLHTGIGTRTQPLDNAQDDLAILDDGIKPTIEVQQEELIESTTFKQLPTNEEAQLESRPSFFRFIYPIGIGAAIAAIIAFITLRKRKNKSSNE